MKIPVLAHSRNSELDHIKTALAILNTSQAKYFYDLRMDDRVPVNGSAIDQHKVRSDLIGRSEELKNAAIITDVPFQNNWFSVTSRGGTIITIHSWDEHFSPPAVKTFILMELILHTAAVTGYLTDGLMERMAHQNPIGCLFDFCIDKREVKFKLVGGHLCGSCADTLIRHKANSDDVFAIRKMLDAMRLDSIGRAPQVDLNKVFVAMRFTANDENDNAYQYGVVPAFESRGLSIDRADSKPSSDFLIKKIFTMIDESWAVIVLGGGVNLNVFFEYGYAVGREKPIFMISSQSDFAQMPTDVKGLEQIVYPDRNYKALRSEIEKHLDALPRYKSQTK